MSGAAVKLVDQDPTVYPIEDDMGEGSLQRFISELLRALIEIWLRSRGEQSFVGADQFFYWQQYNPTESVAPDVYVLPGVPQQGTRVGAWKVWQTGKVPSFVFEVVSQDLEKDYLTAPAKYGRLGVEELIVFDPDHRESSARVRWQVFRRSRSGFTRVEATDADRVRSKVLGCWLRAVGEGDSTRVRLALDPDGEALVPTDAEARARAEAEQHRLAEALESEREARMALERELARLKGEITPPPTSTKREKRRKGR